MNIAEKREEDYILYEVLSILLTTRRQIRNKDVKRYEDKLQAIIDELTKELKAI
jgi:hypothetical protein